MHLNKLPPNVDPRKLNYLGPPMDPQTARSIVLGHIDPHTKLPFEVCGDGAGAAGATSDRLLGETQIGVGGESGAGSTGKRRLASSDHRVSAPAPSRSGKRQRLNKKVAALASVPKIDAFFERRDRSKPSLNRPSSPNFGRERSGSVPRPSVPPALLAPRRSRLTNGKSKSKTMSEIPSYLVNSNGVRKPFKLPKANQQHVGSRAASQNRQQGNTLASQGSSYASNPQLRLSEEAATLLLRRIHRPNLEMLRRLGWNLNPA